MPEFDAPDFDAADIAADILQLDDPVPAPVAPGSTDLPPERAGALGWVLLASLVVAVTVAISLAVQWTPETTSTPEPPTCGGLFSECCNDVDVGRTESGSDGRRGLFDAEDGC